MRRLRLVRTDIEQAVIKTRMPSLVRRHRRNESVRVESRITVINRRTAGKKGDRCGRPTVVLEWAEKRIDVYKISRRRSGIAVGVADEVEAAADPCAGNIRSGGRGVAGHDGVGGTHRSAVDSLVKNAASLGGFSGRVSGDGGVV